MKIALCQFHIVWEDKGTNIIRAEKYIMKASQANCDLILFPEMSFTGFSPNISLTKEKNGETNILMKQMAIQYHIAIGYGWVKENMRNSEKAENHYSVISEMGRILSDYIKIHSFGYGGEGKQFVRGKQLSIFEYKDLCFAQFICYDLRFPEIFQKASKKACVLLIPANWPSSRKGHWSCLLQARAIENQAFVLGINCVGSIGGINYSGDSCLINPDGSIERVLSDIEDLMFVNINKNKLQIRDEFPLKMDRREELYAKL